MGKTLVDFELSAEVNGKVGRVYYDPCDDPGEGWIFSVDGEEVGRFPWPCYALGRLHGWFDGYEVTKPSKEFFEQFSMK